MVELVWAPISLVFLAAAAVSLAAAILVARARRWDAINRWAASLLGLESAIFALTGAHALIQDQGTFTWNGTLITIGILWVIISYLKVVGQLPTRLGGWLAHRAATWILVGIGSAGTALMLAQKELAIASLDPGQAFAFIWVPGPLRELILMLFLLSHLFGLLVALRAWRTAQPTTPARRRYGLFAGVFGFRDVSLLVLIGAAPMMQGSAALDRTLFLSFAIANFAFLALLSYAVLKDQMFDIHIRIKAGLARSIVLSVFAIVFFVASETLEQFVPFDGVYVGIAAAAAIALALRPLHRWATRMADKAMPDVDKPDQIEERKTQVFLAALETVYRDGQVTEKEVRILDTLRKQLGIDDVQANTLQRRFV